ncbi:MAG: S41 family peptidase [Kiloniellales bacterium]|nr:S41 family peptidase [Kiloniellales bacterium]
MPLCLAFGIVACASQDTIISKDYDGDRAERVFSVGYEDITNIYIDDVRISELALAGIDGLGALDPAFSAGQEGDALNLYMDNVRAEQIALPSGEDADDWGEFTAKAVTASRIHSADLKDAESEVLYEAVFEGMLAKLDGFSRYSGREEAKENRASRDGFGGIGVRIRLIEEGVLILSVMEGTPAEESGLLAEDVITAIDGTEVAGLSQREAVSRLRGPLRSEVLLTIDRPDTPDPLEIEVTRAHIIPQTVSYERMGRIAYLQMSGFNQNTTRSLEEKLREAKRDIGATLAGFILDLRDNPGGLLDQSVSVSDIFVSEGRIVTTRGRHPDSHQYFEADSDDLIADLPLVVLMNGGSASAAEIVASALQDSGRAVVVGSVSFGKGTVQTLLRLPNQGELTLTWARFHAPSGYTLNRRGVLPDICTSGEDLELESLLAEVRTGTALIDRDLRGLDISDGDENAVKDLRAICPSREDRPDIDLEVAKRILTDPALYARALQGAPHTAKLSLFQAAE